MAKARRMKEKEKKTSSKLGKYLLILLILILIVFFTLFYLIKTNKIAFLSGFFDNLKFSDVEFFEKKENIDLKSSKYIQGLESVKIISLDVNNSSNMSFIKISLDNTSENKIEKQNVHLSLLDEQGNFVFGSSLSLPKIEPKSQIEFKVVSSSKINDFSSYFLEVE